MTALDVPEPIASFITVVNRHDLHGFLASFAQNGVVDDWGREFTGRDEIRAWSDKEFIGALGTLTPEEVGQDGEEIVVVGDWRSHHANGRSRFAFQVGEHGIERMTIREG